MQRTQFTLRRAMTMLTVLGVAFAYARLVSDELTSPLRITLVLLPAMAVCMAALWRSIDTFQTNCFLILGWFIGALLVPIVNGNRGRPPTSLESLLDHFSNYGMGPFFGTLCGMFVDRIVTRFQTPQQENVVPNSTVSYDDGHGESKGNAKSQNPTDKSGKDGHF